MKLKIGRATSQAEQKVVQITGRKSVPNCSTKSHEPGVAQRKRYPKKLAEKKWMTIVLICFYINIKIFNELPANEYKAVRHLRHFIFPYIHLK